jgi:hypothetical protein
MTRALKGCTRRDLASVVLERLAAASIASYDAWCAARDAANAAAVWDADYRAAYAADDAPYDANNAAQAAVRGITDPTGRLAALLECPNSAVRTAALLATEA